MEKVVENYWWQTQWNDVEKYFSLNIESMHKTIKNTIEDILF